jgi:hypothetical protein
MSEPRPLLIGLAIQAATIVWFVSQMYSDIEVNSINVSRVDQDVHDLEVSTVFQAIQLGKIEENIKGIKYSLEKILEHMEKD